MVCQLLSLSFPLMLFVGTVVFYQINHESIFLFQPKNKTSAFFALCIYLFLSDFTQAHQEHISAGAKE